MAGLILFLVIFINLFFASPTFARITPEDIYQQTRANFENNLSKIQDTQKKQSIITADNELKNINQLVCNRFQLDIDKLSAILEEEKSRQNVTKTVVAYGQGNTKLDTAAYYLNYAAEALAYQRIQDYTPQIGSGNYAGAINNSAANLKSNLVSLQNKILRAKSEVKKAIN
ncbi:MAG: hypothetical protein WCV81_01000 [Microgenomates group bacterium]|jgi:hypothetical protein